MTRDEEEELQQLVPPLQYAVRHELHNGLNRIVIAKKQNVANWVDVRGANIIDALILFFRQTARYFEDLGNRMGKIDTIELCVMSCDGSSRVETYENLDVQLARAVNSSLLAQSDFDNSIVHQLFQCDRIFFKY